MRTEKEIRERLDKLRKERLTQGPYIEKDDIAWRALDGFVQQENLFMHACSGD